MTGFDRETLKEILEGELYRRFLYRGMTKERIMSQYGFDISDDEKKYKCYILFEGELFLLYGTLRKQDGYYIITSINLNNSKFKKAVKNQDDSLSENLASISSFNESLEQSSQKEEDERFLNSNAYRDKNNIKTEQSTSLKGLSSVFKEEDLKNISQTVIKVWLHLMNQKEKVLNMRRKDFSVITYSKYTETNPAEREYPVIYEENGKFRVVFQSGKSEDFYTEFCAKVYAVLTPGDSEVQILQDIRVLDQKEDAKEKIFEFLKMLTSSRSNELTNMIQRLQLTGESHLFEGNESTQDVNEKSLSSLGAIDLISTDENED